MRKLWTLFVSMVVVMGCATARPVQPTSEPASYCDDVGIVVAVTLVYGQVEQASVSGPMVRGRFRWHEATVDYWADATGPPWALSLWIEGHLVAYLRIQAFNGRWWADNRCPCQIYDPAHFWTAARYADLKIRKTVGAAEKW